MKKTPIITGLLLIALLVLVGTVAAHPINFRAHLSGAADTGSQGQGQAKFQLDHNELNDTTAAHIHFSEVPGGSGPIFVSLCGAFGPPPIPVDDCGGPGHPASGSLSLSDQQVSDLMDMISQNRAYVNVHSTVFPAGEIRGQIEISP
jgi:hypothetical protein